MNREAQAAQAVFDKSRCLYDSESVCDAVDVLAEKITEQLKDSNPVVITVMNGGLIPAGMILPKLNFPLHQDYLHASRYQGNTRGGKLDWIVRPQNTLTDRVVLVIDDILDEGITLNAIMKYCLEQGASKVYSCVLVEKNRERTAGCQHADFTGLTVEDVYVFGCGMDYKNYLRNVAGIYAIE